MQSSNTKESLNLLNESKSYLEGKPNAKLPLHFMDLQKALLDFQFTFVYMVSKDGLLNKAQASLKSGLNYLTCVKSLKLDTNSKHEESDDEEQVEVPNNSVDKLAVYNVLQKLVRSLDDIRKFFQDYMNKGLESGFNKEFLDLLLVAIDSISAMVDKGISWDKELQKDVRSVNLGLFWN